MDSTEIIFSLVGGAGGIIGITKTIADIFIIRPRDKKRQKEAIENRAREIELKNLRDRIILKKIKGQLASYENKLLAEFEREADKVIFPVKVRKENFKETLDRQFLKDEYKSAPRFGKSIKLCLAVSICTFSTDTSCCRSLTVLNNHPTNAANPPCNT